MQIETLRNWISIVGLRTRRGLKSFWRDHRAKAALSAFCILVALFDTFWKAISPIAAGAFALAILPWVLGIIEKVTAPGGIEIVFAKVGRQLDAVKAVPDEKDIDAFQYFEGSDPNLAIAMLRVQIERRLREIAEEIMLGPDLRGRPRALRELARDLAKQGAISQEAVTLINDLMPVMNEAVHGVALHSNASDFALSYGPKILALLGGGKAELE